jgi:hypothetical protein
MAAITHVTAPSFLAALVARIDALLGHFEAAMSAAEVYERLDELSDADLAARGVSRADLAKVAAKELDRF